MQTGLIIKAECTIFKNNLQINCKKKSKLSTISLDEKSMYLIIVGKGEDQVFKFSLQKLKSIHKKFIDEGKITLQFDSQRESKIDRGLGDVNQNLQIEGSSKIFISNGCKENLQSLIAQILVIKKKVQSRQSNNLTVNKPMDIVDDKKDRKKGINNIQMQQIQQKPKGTRRNLFELVRQQNLINSGKGVKNIEKPVQKAKKIAIFTQLPKMLLRQILAFSGIALSQRLICKLFEQLVLANIVNIKFKQQVDQATFNKLAKWAINVEGRLKNVKNLKLDDRHDDQVLIKNRAKTLKFGNWKEVTSKQITQLKGLRIYNLQLPYSIKCESSHLFGLRLVELRLKGRNVQVKNSMVKDEDLLYLLKNVKELRTIQVSYASTILLCQIQKPEKMVQIRIGTLNRINNNDEWFNFKKFTSLQILSIENTQKAGINDDHELVMHNATFGDKLHTLEMGFNILQSSRTVISHGLRNLKLLGAHWRNRDMRDFFLPALQQLDISQCPNLTPQCLENVANLKVKTNWNRLSMEQAMRDYAMTGLTITSVRGFTYC